MTRDFTDGTEDTSKYTNPIECYIEHNLFLYRWKLFYEVFSTLKDREQDIARRRLLAEPCESYISIGRHYNISAARVREVFLLSVRRIVWRLERKGVKITSTWHCQEAISKLRYAPRRTSPTISETRI